MWDGALNRGTALRAFLTEEQRVRRRVLWLRAWAWGVETMGDLTLIGWGLGWMQKV